MNASVTAELLVNEAFKRLFMSCICSATALKMNMNLRELYLAENKLNGLQDSAQLGNLLKFNYNVQILDLRNNHILDSGLSSGLLRVLLLVSCFSNACACRSTRSICFCWCPQGWRIYVRV